MESSACQIRILYVFEVDRNTILLIPENLRKLKGFESKICEAKLLDKHYTKGCWTTHKRAEETQVCLLRCDNNCHRVRYAVISVPVYKQENNSHTLQDVFEYDSKTLRPLSQQLSMARFHLAGNALCTMHPDEAVKYMYWRQIRFHE